MPGSEGFYGPMWSPDGKYMAATAQNPSRIVLYTAQSDTWKDLKKFESPWGWNVWSDDSKSLYVDMIAPAPGIEPGFYRLAIADGSWKWIGGLDGLAGSLVSGEPFVSVTSDGRPAKMSDTSVVQIYRAKWN